MTPLLVLLAFLCPHCETVRHAAEPSEALDIVILPDGFDLEALPSYRCAANLLSTQLLEIAPFDDPTRFLNVHRVDLVSEADSGLVASGCTDACSRIAPTLPDVCKGEALSAWSRDYDVGATIPVLRFGAELCGGGQKDRCEFLSVSDWALYQAQLKAQLVPAADLIVILVNTGSEGGVAFTGPMTYYTGNPPVAVVTLSGIAADGCANRLAHELGHAFGLHDEYDYGQFLDGAANDAAVCGPNVTDPLHCADPVPWDRSCTWLGSASCEVDLGPQEGCTANRAYDCCTVKATDFTELPLPDPEDVGLFEGANYVECGYFRPARNCRMRDNPDPFCPVCEKHIREQYPGKTDESTCVLLRRAHDGEIEWVLPKKLAENVEAPPERWDEAIRAAVDGSPAGRFRALIDLDGTSAWVPIRDAEVTFRSGPRSLGAEGRPRVAFTREFSPKQDRMRFEARLPLPEPPSPEPPGPPQPPDGLGPIPIPLGPAAIKIHDVLGETRNARSLKICLGR